MEKGQSEILRRKFEADPFALAAVLTRSELQNCIGEDFQLAIKKSNMIKLLRKHEMFQFIPFSKLEWLAEAFKREEFEKDTIIFEARTLIDKMFYFHRGGIQIYKDNQQIETL